MLCFPLSSKNINTTPLSFPFSLLPESGGDLHIAVLDGLCAAGAALHRAVHPLARDARRVRPGRVQGYVGRRQGDAAGELPSASVNYNDIHNLPVFSMLHV